MHRYTNFLLYTIILIIGVSGGDSSPCIYPQHYWLNHDNEWSSIVKGRSICDTPYPQLMSIDSLELVNADNMYWLTSFHQYCIALLNVANISVSIQNASSSSSSSLPSYTLLNNGLLSMGDSLERHCNNMSAFQMTNNQIAQMIFLFNNGGLIPLCNMTMTTAAYSSSLYYRHNPDLIIIPIINTSYSPLPPPPPHHTENSSLNNETALSTIIKSSIIARLIYYSLLDDEYRVRVSLLILVLVAYCGVIPLLALIIMFIQSHKRDFAVFNPTHIHQENMVVVVGMKNPNVGYPSSSDNEIALDVVKKRKKVVNKEKVLLNGVEVLRMDVNALLSLEQSSVESDDDIV
jgi:hypothetical protein